MTRSTALRDLLVALTLTTVGCVADLDTTREVTERGSFGAIVYQEACQRVAYIAELDERAAGLRQTVDLTGTTYAPVCLEDAPAPESAPAKLKALQQQRGLLVRVVDTVLPEEFLAPLQKFLEAMAVLNDDGTLPGAIESAGRLLEDLAADPGFAPAMGRVTGRGGFRPTELAGGLAGPSIRYSGIDDLLASALDLLLDEKGNPVDELRTLLTALSFELKSAAPLANPADPERTLRLALRLLASPARDAAPPGAKPIFIAQRDVRGAAVPSGQPLGAPFVDQGGDGLADLDAHGRFLGPDGKVAPVGTPFLVPGASDPPGSKRDAEGRLLGLSGSGGPAYNYLDFEGTVLAALLREQVVLANPAHDDLFGLVHGAGGLLGQRLGRTKELKGASGATTKLQYAGFDLARSSLLDLAHAYLQILGAPKSRDLLLATRTLLDTHEDPTSRALGAIFDVNDRAKKPLYAQAKIPATSTLYDELADIIARVLRVPGLAGHLLDALTDKHVLGLAPMIGRLFANNDRFVLNQVTQAVSGSFGGTPDRGKPDSDWNRSVMQRLMHLIHDANGVQFCNKQGASVRVLGLPLLNYDKCKMFRIDDLGLFFALTIVDHSITDDKSRPETRNEASFRERIVDGTMRGLISDGGLGDSFIQGLVGIEGFTRFPTPQAAARSLFLDTAHQSDFMKNSIDPVQCSDGDTFIDAHSDTLFAWEQPMAGNPSGFAGDNFYDAVRPLLNAFAMHDECVGPGGPLDCSKKRNAVKIFLDLVAVLHDHWGSARSTVGGQTFQSMDPKGKRYATGDGAVSYETLLADVMGASDLVPSIIALAPTLNTMTLDGKPGSDKARPVLLEAARYVFDPLVTPMGLAYRDGKTATVMSDGRTPVARATPYYLIADANAAKRAQLAAASPERQGAWRAATSNLVDELLTVEATGMGPAATRRLKNRRLHGVTLALIDFLRDRLDAHVKAGDADRWIQKQLTADLTSALDGPILAGLIDLVGKIESAPDTIKPIYGLLQALAGEDPKSVDGANFPLLLSAAGDLLQLFLDDTEVTPIARAAGIAVDPDRLAPTLQLLKRARDIDPNRPEPGDTTRHTTLVTVLRNFFQPPAHGQAQPISDLGDALSELHRAVPGAGTALDAEDYRLMLRETRTFFIDEQRGFMRFVRVVQNRRLPASN